MSLSGKSLSRVGITPGATLSFPGFVTGRGRARRGKGKRGGSACLSVGLREPFQGPRPSSSYEVVEYRATVRACFQHRVWCLRVLSLLAASRRTVVPAQSRAPSCPCRSVLSMGIAVWPSHFASAHLSPFLNELRYRWAVLLGSSSSRPPL